MAGRKKLYHISAHFRVDVKTSSELSKLAITFGYIRGKQGAVGQLLDAIAAGELVLIPKESWDKITKNS